MPFLLLGGIGPVPESSSRPLNALGWQMLADLPPLIQDDPLTQAVIHAYSQESQRILDKLEALIPEWFPQLSTELGLPLWEARTGLTVNPEGASVEERRALVLAAFRRLLMSPSVVDYVGVLEQIVGPGFVYRESNPWDPAASPPPYTVFLVLPYPAGSPIFLSAERLVRAFTPAWLDVIVGSLSGFKLDNSLLDEDTLA